MPISTIFFDLDDTLYPSSSGVWKLIKERMNLYMHQHLGIAWDAIPALREQYFNQYGTTLKGLQVNYPVDMDEYLNFVHDIPLQEYLSPDEELQFMLQELPFHKFIFTNADSAHANRVLKVLGLEGCFEGIIDIRVIDPYCKPMKEAFIKALVFAEADEPGDCILVDDLPATTRAARALGFFSILFGQTGFHPDADATLARLTELPKLLDKEEH
jgi:putative hydrolase of the HAD superfamily